MPSSLMGIGYVKSVSLYFWLLVLDVEKIWFFSCLSLKGIGVLGFELVIFEILLILFQYFVHALQFFGIEMITYLW